MWLLDTNSVDTYPRLINISEQDLEPPDNDEEVSPKCLYAILSHRWEDADQEVSFDDLTLGRSFDELRKKKGWYKIFQTCRQASADSYQYVWIDTCCIDKRSSAELQEAINSMYHWYGRAAVCYVHLRDVGFGDWEKEFQNSEWFTRGWTLQELLAPKHITFFDRCWVS